MMDCFHLKTVPTLIIIMLPNSSSWIIKQTSNRMIILVLQIRITFIIMISFSFNTRIIKTILSLNSRMILSSNKSIKMIRKYISLNKMITLNYNKTLDFNKNRMISSSMNRMINFNMNRMNLIRLKLRMNNIMINQIYKQIMN